MIKQNTPGIIFPDSSSHFTSDPFIISSALTLSYREFSGLVKSVLPALKKRYRSGERVAILSANRLEYLVLLFSMWRLKIVPVLLNTHWPAAYMADNLQKINCRRIILSQEFASLEINGFKKITLEKLVDLDSGDILPLSSDQIVFNPN
jgi:fatty-acyl-CoA synthase